MRKLLLAGLGGALGLLLYAANAQQIGQTTLSGNECWNAGQGPGGTTTGFVCANVVRNSTANVATTVGGSVTIGTTAGLTALAQGGNLLITAQPSAATITLPPNPVPDGAIVGVCNVTGGAFATNVVTLAANTGQTLAQAATLTTLAAGTCAREQFNLAATTWYRVQ